MADVAGRPAYVDHFMGDLRLAFARTRGRGAALRFEIRAPLARTRGEVAIVEFEPPRRIVEEGRLGRLGRSRATIVYDFVPERGATRVELTAWTEPANRLDAFRELGARRWLRRQLRSALERLRLIFEEPPDAPLARLTVAGYEPLKAPRFGEHPRPEPSREPAPQAVATHETARSEAEEPEAASHSG